MRKLVYGALALSAALAVGFGTGAKDAKADTAVPEIKTEGNDTLIINAAEGTSKILVGVPSFKSNVKSGTSTVKDKQTIAVSTWDVYDGATATVDLSKYPKTKDAYLMIKTDFQADSEAIAVKIPASLSLSASYEKKTGVITIHQADKNKTALTENTLKYYTDSHSEGTITMNNTAKTGEISGLKQYQMSGATLYVETLPKPMTTGTATDAYAHASDVDFIIGKGTTSEKKIVKGTSGDDANKVVKVYEFASRSSKPAKLNITKLANAPKVTPNYVKGTITIPKGAHVQIFSAGTGGAYNTEDDTEAYETSSDKTGTLNVAHALNREKWSSDQVADINAMEKFAVDIYTKGVVGSKLDSRAARYVFDAQGWTDIGLLSYSVSYASGKYTGIVESTDTVNKYTVYYTDASTNHAAKTATTTLQTGTGESIKKGSAKLANIDITQPIYVTRDGNAKTLTWVGTKFQCTGWAAINANSDNIKKYDVVVAKKSADKEDTDVIAAYDAIAEALKSAKTYKKDDKVEITVADADKSKLDAVSITVDNAVSTDSDKLTVSDGKIKFTMKADKKTTITVAKGSFGVSVVAATEDASAKYVTDAVTAIKTKVDNKLYKKNDTVKDIAKAFDSKKVVVTCSGGVTAKDGVYTLTSAAPGTLTVSLAKHNVTVTGNESNIVYSDSAMETAATLTGVKSGTVLYVRKPEGKKVTFSGVTATDVTGGYKITVDDEITITVAEES